MNCTYVLRRWCARVTFLIWKSSLLFKGGPKHRLLYNPIGFCCSLKFHVHFVSFDWRDGCSYEEVRTSRRVGINYHPKRTAYVYRTLTAERRVVRVRILYIIHACILWQFLIFRSALHGNHGNRDDNRSKPHTVHVRVRPQIICVLC